MSDPDPKLVLGHIPNSCPRLLNGSISTQPLILLVVGTKKEYQVQGHWNVVPNLIDGMMMMLSGHLLRVMDLYDHFHSQSELEQLLEETEKDKEHARACLGSGVGASLLSLEGVRVEVEA
jgi:hypothetical protein